MKQTISITEFSGKEENQEAALVDQLAELRGQFNDMMGTMDKPAFGADTTCLLAFRMSSQAAGNYLPKDCATEIQKNALGPYGKPVEVKPETGVLNAFGGKTMVVFADDKDNFLAYAAKVPTDVCAKFAPDYLRCVGTLPKDLPASPAARITLGDSWSCRLEANNNVACAAVNSLPPKDEPHSKQGVM